MLATAQGLVPRLGHLRAAGFSTKRLDKNAKAIHASARAAAATDTSSGITPVIMSSSVAAQDSSHPILQQAALQSELAGETNPSPWNHEFIMLPRA
jgi:hypothetical protein